MRSLICLSVFIGFILFSSNLYSQGDPDGTKFYWYEDWTSNNSEYLDKFLPGNLPEWIHAQGRIDGYAIRRGSAVAMGQSRSNNTDAWQGMKNFIPGTVMVAGMNSGLMNKSWEYKDRQNWINRFSGDVSVMQHCKDAGFSKIVMFLQSPLSKGTQPTFNPMSADSGATLQQRVIDCVEYGKYMQERKPEGIDLSFALIDAFTQKNNFGDRAIYREAFKDLVMAFKNEGLEFDGFIFDAKTQWVMNNVGTLADDAKYVYETIATETGVSLYAGWYTWSNAASQVSADNDYINAMTGIKNHADGKYISHIWIAGNQEAGPHFPDYIDGVPRSRLERLNQTFCILEDLPDNPLKSGDEILGPVNSPEMPPFKIKNFRAEIISTNHVKINWSDNSRNLNYKLYRHQSNSPDILLATLPYTNKSYDDKTVTGGNTYNYYIISENDYGQTNSDTLTVFVSNEVPDSPGNVSIDYSNCYSVNINWNDNADNESEYWLVRKEAGVENDSLILKLPANSNAYTDDDIPVGSSLKYNVIAKNHVGSSGAGYLSAINETCTSTPLAPSNLNAALLMCKEVELSWESESVNETEFELQFAIGSADWVSRAVGRENHKYEIVLPENSDVQFRIRAKNSRNTSGWSNIVSIKTEGCNCNRSTFKNNGNPWTINERIEAEFFDQCLSGVSSYKISWFEPDIDSQGGDLTVRTDSEIDIFSNHPVDNNPGERIVRTGSVWPGEWYEYTVNVPSDGAYKVVARLASNEDERRMKVSVDNQTKSFIDYDFTGGWKYYYEYESNEFELTAGTKIFRLETVSGGTDMDYWKLVPKSASSVNSERNIEIYTYPSPADDYFKIGGDISGSIDLSIIDLKGNVIDNMQFNADNSRTVNTSCLKNGFYIVKLRNQRKFHYFKILILK